MAKMGEQDYYRRLGIEVDEAEDTMDPSLSWLGLLLAALSTGLVLYGFLRLAAWGLRALGVHITGI